MKAKVNKVTIEVIQNNILSLSSDALVVVTDPNLSVSEALLAAAGDSIKEQTNQIGWCEVGSAVATNAGKLSNVSKIIHTVGPRWGEGSERGKLANATWSCLTVAEELQLKSIAMPPISAGALGYPVEACAQIMIERVIDFTFEPLKSLRLVKICLPNPPSLAVFIEEFNRQIENLKETGEGKVRA